MKKRYSKRGGVGACKVCDAICSTNPFYMNMCSKHLVEAKLKQAYDESNNQTTILKDMRAK
jgi:hypothetical protein